MHDPGYVYTIGDWEALPLDASALILASRAGHTEVVRRLLEEPDLDCNKGTREIYNTMRNNQTAFLWACRHGNLEVVRALIADERVDMSARIARGHDGFSLAVQQGQLSVVDELLSCRFWWCVVWDNTKKKVKLPSEKSRCTRQ